MIYLDQSATSLHKPPEVVEAVRRGLSGEYGNPTRGAHTPALRALQEVALVRRAVSKYFDVSPLEVAFTFNATIALNMAIKGALTPQDRVLTTPYAHNSMLRPLYELQDMGMRLDIMPLDKHGCCPIELFVQYLHADTTAIALNPMSNVTGDIAPLDDIIRLCHQRDLLLILDLSQWAGTRAMPSVAQWPRTLIAFTGHKSLYGPQGTGGLINRGNVPLRPMISGGSGIHSFERQHPSTFPEVCEAGTVNLPGIMGLRAGVEWLMTTGQDKVQQHLSTLRERFISGMRTIPGVRLYGSQMADAGPVVSLNIGDLPAAVISDALNERYNIATRAGAHCAPLMHQALGTVEQGTVRFSFSFHNDDNKIDTAIEAIRTLSFQ